MVQPTPSVSSSHPYSPTVGRTALKKPFAPFVKLIRKRSANLLGRMIHDVPICDEEDSHSVGEVSCVFGVAEWPCPLRQKTPERVTG